MEKTIAESIHTIESLEALVTAYKEKTIKLMFENSGIEEISWDVRDIPYVVFNAYREKHNQSANDSNYIDQHALGNRFFYRPATSYGHGCTITFFSTPVRFKTLYEIVDIE